MNENFDPASPQPSEKAKEKTEFEKEVEAMTDVQLTEALDKIRDIGEAEDKAKWWQKVGVLEKEQKKRNRIKGI